MATRKANALAPSNDEYGVRWAAPVRPTTRSNELGELESSILKEPEVLVLVLVMFVKSLRLMGLKACRCVRALLGYTIHCCSPCRPTTAPGLLTHRIPSESCVVCI